MHFAFCDPNRFSNKPRHGSPRWVFDNKVKSDNLDWEVFVEMILDHGHKVSPVKQEMEMFNFTQYLTKEEGAAMSDDGFVKKLKQNTVAIDALILDYDSEDAPSIAEFKQMYAEYEFVLYTSYSHDPANGKTKYRVVIPLTNTIPVSEVEDRQQLTPDQNTYLTALTEYFCGVDACCFQPNRSFYYPACKSEETLVEAEMYYNHGKDFDLHDGSLEPSPGRFIPYVPKPSSGVVGGTGKIRYDTFDIVGFFKDQGLYISDKGGGKHIVECPIACEHTGGDKTGTAIFEAGAGNSGLPGIKCQHHGSTLITYKWLIEFYRDTLGEDAFREYCETDPRPVDTELFEKLATRSTKMRKMLLRRKGFTEEDYQDYLENK